jgi:hypothetical protein
MASIACMQDFLIMIGFPDSGRLSANILGLIVCKGREALNRFQKHSGSTTWIADLHFF